MLTTIEKVNIDPNLPLLICDADEVIFQFMESFEHYLTSNSLFFSYKSFKLNGNIINLKNNKPLESEIIPTLITDFFKKYTIKLKLIDNCKKNLKELNKFLNIIILTNMPQEYAHYRVESLRNHDMHYDVISNKGTKGEACLKLSKKTKKPVIFIDDSPNQILSVANRTKNIYKIHFLQHQKLRKILPKIKESDFNTDSWEKVKKKILKIICN